MRALLDMLVILAVGIRIGKWLATPLPPLPPPTGGAKIFDTPPDSHRGDLDCWSDFLRHLPE